MPWTRLIQRVSHHHEPRPRQFRRLVCAALSLFVSHANRDAALLAHPPTSDLGSDYIKLLDEPVAFAHPSDPTKPPQHPFLTLRAYWSAQRRDIQTLYELNEGGGNYTVLSTVGLVAVALTAGQPSAHFAPLRLSYDPVRETRRVRLSERQRYLARRDRSCSGARAQAKWLHGIA